jgi:hypothetical protein
MPLVFAVLGDGGEQMMSTPESPEPPAEPPERMSTPEPPGVSSPEPRDRMRPPNRQAAIWWQREMVIVAVGIFALLVGGAVGYLLGNSNTRTKFRTRTVAGAVRTVTVPGATTTTPGTATTTPGKTVTTPGKTVTTPGKTITQPKKTVTATLTQTRTVTSSSTATTPAAPQSFNGADTQNLGTIHVASQSLLKWSCAGCSTTTFAISNNSNDASTIRVNSRATASGQTVVDAGTYTDVTVMGSGPWSFTITPGG